MKRQQRDTALSAPSSGAAVPEAGDQSTEQSIKAASAALALALHSMRQPNALLPGTPSYCPPGPAAQLASLCQAYLGAMGGKVSAMGGGVASTAGFGGAESNGAADDLHDDAVLDATNAVGSSSQKRVRPRAPLRAAPAFPAPPASPASSSRLLSLAPELVHSALLFCDARALACLDCTGRALHGESPLGSLETSPIDMAVRASATALYASTPLAVPVGRRGATSGKVYCYTESIT